MQDDSRFYCKQVQEIPSQAKDCNFVKKETLAHVRVHMCVSVSVAKFLRTP